MLLFAAPAPSLGQGETLGEDYLRVSASVAVIRARGQEVTAEGLVRGPMFSPAGDLIGIVSHNITKSGGSEGLGFVVTANTVRSLLVDRIRGFYGFDAMLVSGAMAQALNVPQSGGFLIKQVVKGSIGDRLGLKGGDLASGPVYRMRHRP